MGKHTHTADCGHEAEELVLRARCHLSSPLTVARKGDKLIIRCYTCKREVGTPPISKSVDGSKRRVFEGNLLAPGATGRATWLLESPTDVTVQSGDEEWFAWSEGKLVRITVERLD